jgi:hypothetical protein
MGLVLSLETKQDIEEIISKGRMLELGGKQVMAATVYDNRRLW